MVDPAQLALLGTVVFDLLNPQAIQGIVNKGILAGDIDWVVRGAMYMVVFAVASALFSTGNAWFAARVGEEVGHRSRCSVYTVDDRRGAPLSRKLQEALTEMMRGRTSFVIAHRLSTIRDADVIVAIADGRIVDVGSHDALMAAGGFYHDLSMSRFREGAAPVEPR